MPKKSGKHRINEEIRLRQVRLVDKDGEMVGVVPIEQAMETAGESGLDLVEVSPNADPPVCKILDYGKFMYEEKKREHEAKKKQRGGDFKEIRLRPKTDIHDRMIKLDRARRFLMDGDRVQVTLMFRGREMQHLSRGNEILNEVAKELEDVAKVERHVSRDGRRMHMSLMPKPGLKPPPKKAEQGQQPEKKKKEKKPDLEQAPEQAPEQAQEQAPEQAQEQAPEQAQEQAPEQAPELEPEQEKAKEPAEVDANPVVHDAGPGEATSEAADPPA